MTAYLRLSSTGVCVLLVQGDLRIEFVVDPFSTGIRDRRRRDFASRASPVSTECDLGLWPPSATDNRAGIDELLGTRESLGRRVGLNSPTTTGSSSPGGVMASSGGTTCRHVSIGSRSCSWNGNRLSGCTAIMRRSNRDR